MGLRPGTRTGWAPTAANRVLGARAAACLATSFERLPVSCAAARHLSCKRKHLRSVRVSRPPAAMQNGAPGADKEGESASYEPRVVLVTGGAGFIGSHVVNRLVQQYPSYKVIVLDKLDYSSSLLNLSPALAAGPGRCKFVKGDVLAADLLQYVLEGEGVDTVLHFAAQTHVDASFGNSLSFTLNNTYGTHVLLEACRAYCRVRRFVCVSTDEVYGDAAAQVPPVGQPAPAVAAAGAGVQQPGREGAKEGDSAAPATAAGEAAAGAEECLGPGANLAPTNPYAAAKAGAEMMAGAYHASFGLPTIITRSNNVFGPGQFPEKLIPRFIMLAARGERLPVHGRGEATRAYLFIGDVVEAFDLILHRGSPGQVYNIGSSRERSVLEVADDICTLFRLPAADAAARLAHIADRPFNDRRFFICDPKLEALGWQERTPWQQGLQQTVDWYLRHGGEHWDAACVEAALEGRHQ